MSRSFSAAVSRLVFAFFLVAAVVAPASAQVTIWSPFNVPTAVDQGIRKDADVAYADGERKKLDIYRPEKMDGPAPVVMFVYGGAWQAGARWEYEFVGRAFAAAGYVAVLPDYRGDMGKPCPELAGLGITEARVARAPVEGDECHGGRMGRQFDDGRQRIGGAVAL